MAFRSKNFLMACAVAMCLHSAAFAQSSFTIAKPSDGSTSREKVHVEIPRASIKPGGFVGIYIDDQFHVALNPSSDISKKMFTFTWDTKGNNVPDGEHRIKAVLFEPASQGTDAVNEVASSEIKINIANKIKGPTSLLLRYKYKEGENLDYARNSRAFVVGAESAAGKATGDIDLNAVRSRLVLGIDDWRPSEDVALVRNKLTALTVLTNEQETTLDQSQLTGSVYQELDQRGFVKYETSSSLNLLSFLQQGLAVESSLELPVLPLTPITIGQVWRTPGQSLELPGFPGALQPHVTMENKFEGLEWEGNYQTAKIRQTFKESIPIKEYPFGTIMITSPTITVDRVIYIAYKAGRLIRTTRTLTISGRTTSPLPTGPAPTDPSGENGAANGYGKGRTPPGEPNPYGRIGRPGGPPGSPYGRPPGGPPNSSGLPGGGGRPNRPGQGNGANGELDRPITIKTITDTQYLSSTMK